MKRSKGRHPLIHNSFPAEAPIQPAYMGSPMPPTSPEAEAPQMPSYSNTQMSPSGEY